MAQHIALSRTQHKDLRIKQNRSLDMGDGVMSCIVVPNELRNVQNHYPILLQRNSERDEYRLVALFGFQQEENLFLQNDNWDARYLPFAMDIQPFLIGLTQDENADHQVHIDLDSPRINQEHGIRVFDVDGQPTEYMQRITSKLTALHEGYQSCPEFIQCLQKFDLIEPLTLEIELLDTSVNRLVGFHTINEDKLKNLETSALEELQTKNYLLPVFMMVASLSNIVDLVERKNGFLKEALGLDH